MRPPGAQKPALGSLKVEADTKVALAERLVSFSDMKITEANFPTLPKEQTREVVAEIDKSISDDDRVIALDRVLASVDKSQIMPKNVEGVKADPPTIFYSEKPAVLVNIDGEPIWSPIKENDLKFAVNTNWDLFQHGPTKLLLPAAQPELARGGRPQGPVEARRASSPTASPSCRRTRTGKRSSPRCRARRSPPRRCRR